MAGEDARIGGTLRPATWDDVIRHEAKQARVPPELALAMAETESGFDPHAVSPKGARGMFQLMPETAQELGIDPNDPIQNIRGGLKYFRQQLDAHGGNVEKALQAYNWGPGNVAKGGAPPAETQQYVSRILSRLPGPQGPQPAKLAPITLRQMTQGIGQPPPGQRQQGAVATPPPSGPSVFDKGLVQSVAESFDPRTAEGRRNLAGGIGAAVGTALTAPVSVPAMITAGTAGAIGAGFLAESGEQLAGTKPPSAEAIGLAGAEQGAYELGGQALLFPLGAIGRRVMGSRVGKAASTYFDTALEGARDAVQWAREAGRTAIGAARETGEDLVRGVRREAETAISRATSLAESGVEAAQARYGRIATAPPGVTPRVAGQRAQAVMEGPAKAARDEIGQMVDEAAKSGPDVDIRDLKAEAQRILGEEIQPSGTAFPKGTPAAEVDPTLTQLQQLASSTALTPEAIAKLPPSGQVQAQAILDALAAAEKSQAEVVLKHPAMQVIGRILNAEDTVPFYAAHQFKRELDEAIGTAWDRSVRNRVTNITKVLRGSLRDALGQHQPYNEATAAYQAIAPLFSGRLARQLQTALKSGPEKLVQAIKGNDPTKLALVRDLLLSMPSKVGKQNEGQVAWDTLRAVWTDEHLIRGPLKSLEDRIAKIDGDFLKTMYGDGPGSMVLENLKSISAAFKQATEQGLATVAEAEQVGKGAVEEAQRLKVQGVRAAQRQDRQLVGTKLSDLQNVKAEAKKFVRSSLVRAKDEELISDALRAGGLGINSIWGAQSIARLILNGPRSADLIKYAAFSPKGTQLLVQILTNPAPGLAVADLLRLSGLGTFITEGVGTPPPREQPEPDQSLVGAPPP